jgi:hypothetical protein
VKIVLWNELHAGYKAHGIRSVTAKAFRQPAKADIRSGCHSSPALKSVGFSGLFYKVIKKGAGVKKEPKLVLTYTAQR